MEAVLYKYEEDANKASSDMDVESLTLEEDVEKENSENNIDAVSTEDVYKASSENVEALPLGEDVEKSKSEKNIDSVSTETQRRQAVKMWSHYLWKRIPRSQTAKII